MHAVDQQELVDELVTFWFSTLKGGDWEQRLKLLSLILEQLSVDLETVAECEQVSSRFVAGVIERWGAPAVETEAQARIYAMSAEELHQDASRAWNLQHRSDVPVVLPNEQASPSDRRRFPRTIVNILTDIWIQGFTFPCRLVDISMGGARVAVQGVEAPRPGTEVRVVVPNQGVCDAIVVFVKGSLEMGLSFLEPAQSAQSA